MSCHCIHNASVGVCVGNGVTALALFIGVKWMAACVEAGRFVACVTRAAMPWRQEHRHRYRKMMSDPSDITKLTVEVEYKRGFIIGAVTHVRACANLSALVGNIVRFALYAATVAVRFRTNASSRALMSTKADEYISRSGYVKFSGCGRAAVPLALVICV